MTLTWLCPECGEPLTQFQHRKDGRRYHLECRPCGEAWKVTMMTVVTPAPKQIPGQMSISDYQGEVGGVRYR